jgi:hypothetical protein
MTMAKEENVPEGYKQLVQARKILTEARTKFTAIESTASANVTTMPKRPLTA